MIGNAISPSCAGLIRHASLVKLVMIYDSLSLMNKIRSDATLSISGLRRPMLGWCPRARTSRRPDRRLRIRQREGIFTGSNAHR
jgi:hypothetical protein